MLKQQAGSRLDQDHRHKRREALAGPQVGPVLVSWLGVTKNGFSSPNRLACSLEARDLRSK